MLIVGCGDVGRKIAAHARQQGVSPRCLVRSAESAIRLTRLGLDAMVADLDSATPILSDGWDCRQIFYLAPPPANGTGDPRMQRFLAALPSTEQQRIVYISTTGVYGDCRGEWVDEQRPPNPQVDRARRRHDAEQRLLAWRAESRGEALILRVAGIYGPGKLPLARIEKQVPMIGEDEAPWTNRIHIDDLVHVCEAAMTRGKDGEIYNVSDGSPGNMRDYFDRIADRFGLPRPPLISLAEASTTLSPGLLSYLGESRRLDNSKMLKGLGVELRYPDLISGLATCDKQAD
jgi:nucleoside-diphosphate-sugar epimerase